MLSKQSLYAVLKSSNGGQHTGIYGTWNRATMTCPGANGSNFGALTSEMWLVQDFDQLGPWVETGLLSGWDRARGVSVALEVFNAYSTDGNDFVYNFVADVSANSSITDEYQISRSGTTNKFNVYYTGAVFQTGNVGFWTAEGLQMGGEALWNNCWAGTYNMYGKAVNGSGQLVNWPSNQFGSTHAVFNGGSYQNSEWTWNVKN